MLSTLLEKANKLPMLPGVYIMQDQKGEVIYVGKAKLLKNRVSSYFRGEHDTKTEVMVSRVRDFSFIVASSEFEALMLENSLIKRHRPQYNILLKDDKGYPFLRLNPAEYPTFSIVSKPDQDGAKYFGPFGGRQLTRNLLDLIYKTLKLPQCSKSFPRDIGKDRPCLNYHMGYCAGYCRIEADPEQYKASIKDAELILSGRAADLKKELESKMLEASEALLFERAAEYRDRIRSIDSLQNKQRVINVTRTDTDVIGLYRGAKCCFTIMHYVEGKLAGKDSQFFDDPIDTEAEFLPGLLYQFYSTKKIVPQTILLPAEIDDADTLAEMLSSIRGQKVTLDVPKRGDKLQLVSIASVNAREECAGITTAQERRQKNLEWLQKAMDIPSLPARIEAFDVSNLGNTDLVAAMTVFSGGKPLKRDYKKFKIKTADSQDDYRCMREVVGRRYRRLIDSDAGFADAPDLILIDGGHVHAKAASEELSELGLHIPVFGMVKDNRHRTRALVSPAGQEIGLSGNPSAFALIGGIQEETHRFAVEYMRTLRKAQIGSSLDVISGVGPKRRSELISHFKSIKAIREASLEELCSVVPKNTAEAVYTHFRKLNTEPKENEE